MTDQFGVTGGFSYVSKGQDTRIEVSSSFATRLFSKFLISKNHFLLKFSPAYVVEYTIHPDWVSMVA